MIFFTSFQYAFTFLTSSQRSKYLRVHKVLTGRCLAESPKFKFWVKTKGFCFLPCSKLSGRASEMSGFVIALPNKVIFTLLFYTQAMLKALKVFNVIRVSTQNKNPFYLLSCYYLINLLPKPVGSVIDDFNTCTYTWYVYCVSMLIHRLNVTDFFIFLKCMQH